MLTGMLVQKSLQVRCFLLLLLLGKSLAKAFLRRFSPMLHPSGLQASLLLVFPYLPVQARSRSCSYCWLHKGAPFCQFTKLHVKHKRSLWRHGACCMSHDTSLWCFFFPAPSTLALSGSWVTQHFTFALICQCRQQRNLDQQPSSVRKVHYCVLNRLEFSGGRCDLKTRRGFSKAT